jgi:hypothetical protein
MTLTILRRDGSQIDRVSAMFSHIDGSMNDSEAGGVLDELFDGSNRPWRKTSAAVWANIFKHVLDAMRTEGAFIGAYAGFE